MVRNGQDFQNWWIKGVKIDLEMAKIVHEGVKIAREKIPIPK